MHEGKLLRMRHAVRTREYLVTTHADEERHDDERQDMPMSCEICGREGTRVRHVTRSYGQGDDLLVVENVPVVSCPHCGGDYLTAETMHALDEIKSNRRTRATSRQVAVATY